MILTNWGKKIIVVTFRWDSFSAFYIQLKCFTLL